MKFSSLEGPGTPYNQKLASLIHYYSLLKELKPLPPKKNLLQDQINAFGKK